MNASLADTIEGVRGGGGGYNDDDDDDDNNAMQDVNLASIPVDDPVDPWQK